MKRENSNVRSRYAVKSVEKRRRRRRWKRLTGSADRCCCWSIVLLDVNSHGREN